MIIDDSDTICSLCDKLPSEFKDIKEKIKELSTYDEFLIADVLRYLSLKYGQEEVDRFWIWESYNASEYAGVRRYDKIIVNTRYQCGIEVL